MLKKIRIVHGHHPHSFQMDRGDITACRCMRHACIKMILDRWTCCQYSIKKRYIHLHTNNPCKAPSLYRDLFVYAVVTPSTLHFAERYYLPDVIFCLTQTDTAKRGQCLFRMHIQRQKRKLILLRRPVLRRGRVRPSGCRLYLCEQRRQ